MYGMISKAGAASRNVASVCWLVCLLAVRATHLEPAPGSWGEINSNTHFKVEETHHPKLTQVKETCRKVQTQSCHFLMSASTTTSQSFPL